MSNYNYPEENICLDVISSNITNSFFCVKKMLVCSDYLQLILSSAGCTLNLAILFVFHGNKFKTRFYKLLKFYSYISLIILTEFFIISFTEFNRSIASGFYVRLFFHSLLYTIVTFSRTLDTFIIYERIQLYKPLLKFISKISLGKLVILFFTIAILANLNEIPLLIDRYNIEMDMLRKFNVTEKSKSSLFIKKRSFKAFSYFMLISKFLICFTLDLVLSLYLLKIMKSFHRKISDYSEMKNRKAERNNTIIAVFLCLITTTHSIGSFIHNFIYINNDLDLSVFPSIYTFVNFLIILKYSINFFLFYFFNKKFKDCFRNKCRILLCNKKNIV